MRPMAGSYGEKTSRRELTPFGGVSWRVVGVSGVGGSLSGERSLVSAMSLGKMSSVKDSSPNWKGKTGSEFGCL